MCLSVGVVVVRAMVVLLPSPLPYHAHTLTTIPTPSLSDTTHRDRIGGRVHTEAATGWDLGASWLYTPESHALYQVRLYMHMLGVQRGD